MDDRKEKGPADRSRINMGEPWEVDYWTKELGVSASELRKLIAKVGTSVEAVQRELGIPAKHY